MIVFGCCVGPGGRFESLAAEGLAATMAADDVLVTETGDRGICAAYNAVLRRARALPDCDLVVLLHDDVELVGGVAVRAQLLDSVRADEGPPVGVAGVVGGRGLFGPQWVDARHLAGTIDDFHGRRTVGPPRADVDAVDGLLLALAPAAFAALDFDEAGLPAFHGYDTDYCLRALEAGLRVRVAPIGYRHHDRGHIGGEAAFADARRHLLARWPDRIAPLGRRERAVRLLTQDVPALAGRARHRVAVVTKRRLTTSLGRWRDGR